MNQLTTKLFLLLLLLLQSGFLFAGEQNIELAKAVSNPLKVNHYAKHISLPFETETNFDYGPYNNTQNILEAKPIIPFRFTQSYDLIGRVIAPIFERTPTTNSQKIINGNYINGWGDMNPTLFISPAHFRTVIWGIGPTVFIPSATNNKNIGSGKWSLGPELAFVALPDNWVFGFITYNIWSVAGDPNRAAVGQFSFQYFISYVFADGWYVNSNPEITANWKKPKNQQWIVPFGLGVGRVLHWGNQPVSLSTHAYYNAIRPASVGPNWQLQVSLEFVFSPLIS